MIPALIIFLFIISIIPYPQIRGKETEEEYQEDLKRLEKEAEIELKKKIKNKYP